MYVCGVGPQDGSICLCVFGSLLQPKHPVDGLSFVKVLILKHQSIFTHTRVRKFVGFATYSCQRNNFRSCLCYSNWFCSSGRGLRSCISCFFAFVVAGLTSLHCVCACCHVIICLCNTSLVFFSFSDRCCRLSNRFCSSGCGCRSLVFLLALS